MGRGHENLRHPTFLEPPAGIERATYWLRTAPAQFRGEHVRAGDSLPSMRRARRGARARQGRSVLPRAGFRVVDRLVGRFELGWLDATPARGTMLPSAFGRQADFACLPARHEARWRPNDSRAIASLGFFTTCRCARPHESHWPTCACA